MAGPRVAPNVGCFALSSVRYALVWSGFRVCYRVGGCAPKGSSYGGLVVTSCAVPVWKLSFVLILGHLLAPSLERLWGALGGREASQMEPGDFQETRPDDPKRLLGVSLGCLWGPGLPRGAGGLKETTQATQKGSPAAEARRFKQNTKKRRALACVEMCTPSRQEAHIGQTRVPGERESRRLTEN